MVQLRRCLQGALTGSERFSALSSGSWLGHDDRMQKTLAIVVGGGLCLATVFFLGQKWGYHRGTQEMADVAETQSTKSKNHSRPLGSSAGTTPREEYSPGKQLVRAFFAKNSSEDPQAFMDIAMRALEVNNTMERKAALRELMVFVKNTEQVLAIQKAFEEVTRTTGRDHFDIWKEFLHRSGEKLGVKAMAAFTEKEGLNSGLVWVGFRGWASREPEQALQWLDEKSELGGEQWRRGFLGMAMESAVLDDGPVGEMLMNSLSQEDQLHCMKQFCTGLIQSQGLDGALVYYRSIEGASDEVESPVAARARYLIHDRIKKASADKKGVSYFVDQVAQLHAVRPFELENFGAMARNWNGGVALSNRLDFLESVETQFEVTGDDLARVIAMSGVIDLGQKQSEGFQQWVQEHPNSGLLDDLQAAREAHVDFSPSEER